MAKANKSGPAGLKPGSNSTKGPGSSNTTSKIPGSYLSKLCEKLENASAGLLHISESDRPYEFFVFRQSDTSGHNDKLTPIEFLNGIGLSEELIDEFKIPVDQLIEERAPDDFFPTIDDLAAYYGLDASNKKVIAAWKRYQKLVTLLNKSLKDVRVFRVGKIEIRCYVAGFAKNGNIAGLVTTAIET